MAPRSLTLVTGQTGALQSWGASGCSGGVRRQLDSLGDDWGAAGNGGTGVDETGSHRDHRGGRERRLRK